MTVANIINVAVKDLVVGGALGATAGAIFPAVGIGAGMVYGVSVYTTYDLADNMLERVFQRNELNVFRDELNSLSGIVLKIGKGVISSYAGLHAANLALTSIGFTATVVPSAILALKITLVILAIQIGAVASRLVLEGLAALAGMALLAGIPYFVNTQSSR